MALQSCVSRLRGLAGPDTERLLPRHSRGYTLDPDAAEVDTRRFVDLSERGRAEVSGSRWRDARHTLRAAGRLWRGTPFTGIDDVPALCTERSRLDALRGETRLSELQAVLEADGPADVIAPLRELVDTHPWDERGWRLLMLALYRAGRQTEALEAGARARGLLVDEQGLDPSPELAELERRILVHDRGLEPTPPRARRSGWLGVPATPLVGRDRELATLLEAWAGVTSASRARLVVVNGEPGVGKSHLVARVAGDVERTGGAVLAGRCLDEPRLPLQPWSNLVPDIATRACDATAGPHEGHPMVDVWEVAAHRLFTAVTELVGRTLESAPTLLVVEDVHWAGSAALRLLDHVLACCAEAPLLVVATARSSGAAMPPDAKGAFGELTARAQPHLMRLDGLSAADLHTMLLSLGHRVSDAEAMALWERTGGVPLLAVEALRGGQDVLAARLGQVGDAAVELAELLAVTGDAAPFAVLHAASGSAEEPLESAFGELIGAGLVRQAPGDSIAYSFSHALYREALIARLPELRRLVLSRRVLVASDLLPNLVPPSTVAHHALTVARTCAPTDIVRARDACRQAAEWSTRCHEHHDALRWLSDALELARPMGPTQDGFADLELAYGQACRRAGQPHARDAFVRAAALARRRADHPLLARIGVAWSRGFFSQVGQVDTDFVAVMREALDPPEQLPVALRASATAALAAELTWAADGDERFGLADTALDLARSAGDPMTLANVLAARHLTVAAADTLAIRRRDTAELLDLAVELDDVGLRFDALFHRGGPAIEDGQIRLLEALLAEAGQIADLLRQPALQWSIGWSRASLLLWQGALPAAEKLANESAEQGTAAGHPAEAMTFLGGQLMEIRRLQGRLAELAPMLQAIPVGTPDAFSIARHLCAAGLDDAARAHLDTVRIDGGRLRLRRDLLERPSLDNLAFLAARLGRRDLADAVRVRLEPLADTFGHGVVAHPVGHHWLGVLAIAADRHDDAIAHLRQAVTRHAELDLPLLQAESHLELARAHQASGDRASCAEARAAARRLAAGQGAAGLVAEAERPLLEGG